MTHPTEEDQQDPAVLRLMLDSGETLTVRPAGGPDGDRSEVALRLSAARAYDLSLVLDAYTKMVELLAQASEVSSTEDSLARALRDAAAAAGQRIRGQGGPARVATVARLRAMTELQAARADLDHSSVAAVVDAAALWLDRNEDYNAAVLMEAVAGDGAGSQAYLTLIGYGHPRPADEHP